MAAADTSDDARLRASIRDIADFPTPGIVFKDLSPLLRDPEVLADVVNRLVAPYVNATPTMVVAIEARGFIFGSLAAMALTAGFVPARKPGKLPADTYSVDYQLEYGSDSLQMHRDALQPGDRVLLVDDLIATGGTAAAAAELVRRSGASLCGAAFVVELETLQGRARLSDCHVHSLLRL